MPEIKWLPEALADIDRLHAFLEGKNLDAAARAAATILEGAKLLEGSLHIGRPMPDDTGRRELVISFGAGAYVLRYIPEKDDTAVVLRVWHSREDRATESYF